MSVLDDLDQSSAAAGLDTENPQQQSSTLDDLDRSFAANELDAANKKPSEKPSNLAEPNSADFIVGNLARGASYAVGGLVDIPYNIGKMAYGSGRIWLAQHGLTNETPSEAASHSPEISYPVSDAIFHGPVSDETASQEDYNIVPKSHAGKYAATSLQFVGGAPLGGLRGAAANVVSGLSSEAAKDIFPDSKIAPIVGALLPGAMKTGANVATRKFIQGEPGQMENTISDFENVGTTPSLGQASGNRTAQAVESFLGASPGSAGVMHKKGVKQQAEIGGSLSSNFPDIGSSDTGQLIRNGITGDAGFKSRLMESYDQAMTDFNNRHVPQGQRFPVDNALSKITDLTSQIQGAPNVSNVNSGAILGDPLIGAFMKDASEGGGRMPFQAIKAVRTVIGKKAESPDIVGTPLQGAMKTLYGSLTNDMRGAAASISPQALRSFDAMNDAYSRGRNAIDFLQPYVNKDLPADTFKSISSAAQKDPIALATLKYALTGNEWNQFRDSYLGQMARAKPGQQNAEGSAISTNSFLTNWNSMNPHSRELLLEGHPSADKIRSLTKVSENLKEGSKVFANPSGTAGKTNLLETGVELGGAATALATGNPHVALGIAASTLGSAYAKNKLARMVTDPDFVKDMSGPARLEFSRIPLRSMLLGPRQQSSDDAAQ